MRNILYREFTINEKVFINYVWKWMLHTNVLFFLYWVTKYKFSQDFLWFLGAESSVKYFQVL